MDTQQLQKKQDEEQLVEGVHGKRPYQTPTLTKLGSVEQVTHGDAAFPVPDNSVDSF